jgi:hypothetical protein
VTGTTGKAILFCCLFFCFLILTGTLCAESLWKPGFPGYAASGGGYGTGDIISVLLDISTTLSLDSVQKSNDSTQMSFSGSQSEGLFSFLPSARAGSDRSVEGSHDLSMSAVLAARVVDMEPSGTMFIRGRRQIMVNGTMEQITVEGSVSARNVTDSIVRFEDLADARLIWETNAFPAGEVLQDGDIVYDISPDPELGPELEPELGPELGPDGEIELEDAAPPVEPSPGVRLEESRERELFRQYANRFLQLLFTGGATP